MKLKGCILFVVFVLLHATVYAFSGNGSGTEKDPFVITTSDELFEVRSNLSAYYKLGNDINLSSFIQDEFPKYGWSPIGNINAPFTGVFDGNNHAIRGLFINRDNEDNVGLFGYVDAAIIKNLAIIHPQITGNDGVGGLVGTCYSYNNITISNIIVKGGKIEGNNFIGGIIGRNKIDGSFPNSETKIVACMVDAKILGGTNIGGIIGQGISASRTQYSSYTGTTYYNMYLEILNNQFSGIIIAENCAGGVIGKKENSGNDNHTISQNLVIGNIHSLSLAGGICGESPITSSKLYNNVCIADTISGTNVYRIADNVSVSSNNYAYNGTVLVVNGKVQTDCEDNCQNGIAYGLRSLKKQSIYEGLGFDFANTWKIRNDEGFPYFQTQTDPVTISEFCSGSKATITGSASANGTIGAIINGNLYESYIVDGKWSLSVGNVNGGTEAQVFSISPGFMPSPSVKTKAAHSSNIDPDIVIGDSNGDGTVDAADVVSIINYILGKPSSSFNQRNADINDDGQILIDDAVGTVNEIINAQQ